MVGRPVVRAVTRSHAIFLRVPRRTLLSRSRPQDAARPQERLNINQLSQQHYEYHRNRRNFLAAGAVAGVVSFIYTAWKLKERLVEKPKLDTTLPSTDPLVAPPTEGGRKVVLHDKDGNEIVPTGNSTVPEFPRTLELSSFTETREPGTGSFSAGPIVSSNTEYTLVGLGVRTVSFLNFQVYVVGYYVATADIAALQSVLVKKVNSIATTLVPSERDELRAALLDPSHGEETWDMLLRSGIPARSLMRIVPVRDTDFHHLRDGFVRAIQSRSDKLLAEAPEAAAAHDAFGRAVADFRGLFNRGKVPKRKEMLLLRDGHGKLSIVYDEGSGAGRQLLGHVDSELLSRAMWLNYLAGKKVASEEARKNIVDGIMELVERPVGTVATQVV